ncbi:MAG: hypothetical protein KDD60_02275 [Bdellovibrionales bacterium]|nr:hypothetical protein [Bdellovibrionales bacterium]
MTSVLATKNSTLTVHSLFPPSWRWIGFFLVLILHVSPCLALETPYLYEWKLGDIGENFPAPKDIDNAAGTFQHVRFSYDTTSQVLSIAFTMRPPANVEQNAKVFSFVVSPGIVPDEAGNELAIFYLDFTSDHPIVTAYTYEPNALLWESGSWNKGEKLCSSLDLLKCGQWVTAIRSWSNSDGSQTFFFNANVRLLNTREPEQSNVNHKLWRGAEFLDSIGFWISAYGYPNFVTHYSPDGFLSDFHPGQSIDSTFQGSFKGNQKNTFRLPYCDTQNSSLVLRADEPFEYPVTAMSPSTLPITFSHSTLPTGSSVILRSANANNDIMTAVFQWTPQLSDVSSTYEIDFRFADDLGSTQCTLELQVIPPQEELVVDCAGTPGGGAHIDRCGICGGNGSSCLGCSEVDLFSTQQEMDTNAKKQLRFLRKLNERYRIIAKGTRNEREAILYLSTTNMAGRAFYKSIWKTSWVSIPSSLLVCTNQIFCSSTSNFPAIESFVSASDSLLALSRDTREKLLGLGSDARRLLRRARISHTKALAAASEIPPSASECISE